VTVYSYLSGNANTKPASAEEIEKAIAAAQAKMSQSTSVLALNTMTFLVVVHLLMLYVIKQLSM